MTRNLLILLASAGSAALLIGAFIFQYGFSMAPCHLCILQRWPHAAAVVLGGLAIALGTRILPVLGFVAAMTTAGIGLYHTAVERHWVEGPTSCTSGDIGSLSPEEMRKRLEGSPLVQCDAVAWEMFGLSMASWNALISLGLAGLWLAAAMRPARRD